MTPDRPTAVVFAASVPFPPGSGSDLRVAATVRALRHSHAVTVFTLGPAASTSQNGIQVRPSRAFAAGATGRLGQASLSWMRHPEGHPSDAWYSDAVLEELGGLVTEVSPRLTVLEGLWLHRYITPLGTAGGLVVLDAHGIEAALHEELAARNPARLARSFAERTRLVEARAFAAVDCVWVPSQREADLARARYGADLRVDVVPNAIDVDAYAPAGSERGARGSGPEGGFRVVFTATFSYPPNVVASGRLLGAVMPQLHARVPSARLALVGRDPTEEMLVAAAGDEAVEVTGWVEDVVPHLARADALAVPLTEGHGTRFKVLEAFASRVPVVSSQKGIEGIDAVADRHYLAAETDSEFADALARLATQPELGRELADRAQALVRERYSLEAVTASVNRALAGG